MNATLIDFTGIGTNNPARHAANVLLFTKLTRLTMDVDLWDCICDLTWGELNEELAYMANTIPSSWEFVSYTFLLTGVTRAFTHQLVRTRTGSYAQQTMRVLDVGDWSYGTGPTADLRSYHECMEFVAATYKQLIGMGVAIEDARGVLPTNIHTNIVAKFDLRALCNMFRKRASSRTQGEYRAVIEAMKVAVLEVHPWANMFLERTFDKAAKELESGIQRANLETETKTHLTKLIDQLRATA